MPVTPCIHCHLITVRSAITSYCYCYCIECSYIELCVTMYCTVGLYSEMGGQLALFSGTAGGVTQLMFSPDGNYLFSGCRKVSWNHCFLFMI